MKLKKIKLPFKIKKPILALGPQTKNTVCFGEGNFAYLSPVYLDLSIPKDFSNFERTAKCFLKKRPKIIAYDLHPEYQSTKYALNLKPNTYHLIPIQHHHAHIASCMVENNLNNEKVIGVAFDGTGFGSNNNLWGAEFLIGNYRGFKRAAHLKEIPLLGGERAILEPARIAAVWRALLGWTDARGQVALAGIGQDAGNRPALHFRFSQRWTGTSRYVRHEARRSLEYSRAVSSH